MRTIYSRFKVLFRFCRYSFECYIPQRAVKLNHGIIPVYRYSSVASRKHSAHVTSSPDHAAVLVYFHPVAVSIRKTPAHHPHSHAQKHRDSYTTAITIIRQKSLVPPPMNIIHVLGGALCIGHILEWDTITFLPNLINSLLQISQNCLTMSYLTAKMQQIHSWGRACTSAGKRRKVKEIRVPLPPFGKK